MKNYTKAERRPITQRIIMALDGREKQGKTHFSFTSPGDIAYIDFDMGSEGVLERFVPAKNIYVCGIQVPATSSKLTNRGVIQTVDIDQCEKQWDTFISAYRDALNSKSIRSIIIDTATEANELVRLARFGRLTQVLPYNYGPVNAEFRDLVRLAFVYDKNVIFIHKEKPKYVNDKRTSEYERAGLGDMGFLVQLNAKVFRGGEEEGEENTFGVRVVDCRLNIEISGEVLSGPLCNFPTLASLVFSETSPGDWE